MTAELVMENRKFGFGKSWKSHGISFPRFSGNPVKSIISHKFLPCQGDSGACSTPEMKQELANEYEIWEKLLTQKLLEVIILITVCLLLFESDKSLFKSFCFVSVILVLMYKVQYCRGDWGWLTHFFQCNRT